MRVVLCFVGLSRALVDAAGLRGVSTFDHHVFDEYADHTSDLVLLLEGAGDRAQSMTPAAEALQQLQNDFVDRKSWTRKFQWRHCRNCRELPMLQERWRLEADADMPLLFIFPHGREETEGRFRLDLKGVQDPKTNMEAFLERYNQGELHPWVKSEPVPEDQQGGVLEVVGSTFGKLVLEAEQSVLVMFYTPWCGFCRKLQPVFEQVGRRLGASNPHALVARIDHGQNDHPIDPYVSIRGVPALVLYPKGDKHRAVWYSGRDRSYDAILEWMAEPYRSPGLKEWLATGGLASKGEQPDDADL